MPSVTDRNAPIPLSHRDQLNAASTALLLAWASDTIWWSYRGAGTFATYEIARDRYVDFFRYDERAHLNNLVVHLWSLFDKRKGTVSLGRLVSDAALDATEQRALETVLSQLTAPVRKLGILRHELIAHRTNSFTYNEVFVAADIKHDDISQVLDGARLVLNRLRLAAGLSEWFPNEGTQQDVEAVLRVLGGDG